MDISAYLKQEKGIVFGPQQTAAIEKTAGKTLLLAVPGSGKTTVLTARLANLILNKKVPANTLLTITFSREAARDMARRFEELFGGLCAQTPCFSTIHSLCYRILKRYANRVQRPMPQLLEGNSRLGLLRQICRELDGGRLSEDDLEYLSNRISWCKNRGLPYSREYFFGRNLPHPQQAAELYDQWKRERGKMDFDDMTCHALTLLHKLPGLRESLIRQYRHVSLDEAQDTSEIQGRIIRLFAQNSDSYFAVGDEDQSIYGFRGACPEQLFCFSKDYPEGEILKMEENFRSGTVIVNRANQFIGENKQRHPKQMVSHNSPGAVTHLKLKDYGRQYGEIVRLYREHPNRQLAVLYRYHDSGVPLADRLLREDIPFYQKENRQGFFASAVVRDIQDFLRLSVDPCNLKAFGSIYYKLFLSRMMYEFVSEHLSSYDSVWEALLSMHGLSDFQKDRIRQYQRDFPALRLKAPSQAIRAIELNLGYGDYLDSKMGGEAMNRLRMQGVKAIAEHCRTVFDFLARLRELPELLESQATPNAPIFLSTVHAAKGMEFDRVVVLDVMDGIFPASFGRDSISGTEDREEEARLFYVAATRAKQELILFTSDRQNGDPAAPSAFLSRFLSR